MMAAKCGANSYSMFIVAGILYNPIGKFNMDHSKER
jgi:hypothetical protein